MIKKLKLLSLNYPELKTNYLKFIKRYEFNYKLNNIICAIKLLGNLEFDKKEEDNSIHDPYRIDFLKAHIEEMKVAMEEGCEVIAYCTWSFTDLLSWLNGYQKRYGFVYVDRTGKKEYSMLGRPGN